MGGCVSWTMMVSMKNLCPGGIDFRTHGCLIRCCFGAGTVSTDSQTDGTGSQGMTGPFFTQEPELQPELYMYCSKTVLSSWTSQLQS